MSTLFLHFFFIDASLLMLVVLSRSAKQFLTEISASRRLSSIQNQTEVLFQLLDASLSASASPNCSLKMALMLTQVKNKSVREVIKFVKAHPALFDSALQQELEANEMVMELVNLFIAIFSKTVLTLQGDHRSTAIWKGEDIHPLRSRAHVQILNDFPTNPKEFHDFHPRIFPAYTNDNLRTICYSYNNNCDRFIKTQPLNQITLAAQLNFKSFQ